MIWRAEGRTSDRAAGLRCERGVTAAPGMPPGLAPPAPGAGRGGSPDPGSSAREVGSRPPTAAPRVTVIVAVGWLALRVVQPAAAQPVPAPVVGADVQIGTSALAGAGGLTAAFVADTFAAAEWPAVKVVVRPVSRRLASGEWRHDLYQLAVRYERASPLPVRVEAGYLAPVVGLASARSRPGQVVSLEHAPHYFVPLPRLEPGAPSVRPVTTPYPLGLVAATGATRWDVRGGVVDASPVRRRGVVDAGDAPLSPQALVGGGWSPATGLRVGATYVRGVYDRRGEGPTKVSRVASVAALELELERRHTALTGEIVRSRFEISTGAAAATSGFVEVRQALSARWTVAGRYDGAAAPRRPAAARLAGSRLDAVQAAASLRLTRDVAVRAGVLRERTYYQPWHTAAGVGLVVSGRWP
jgi:hypothetical protein